MRDELDRPSTGAGISALQRYLDGENDVLRCAAIRALPKAVEDRDERRTVLIGALLDPDPDVRCDAMEALAREAVADDVPVLLRSLEGDPVREVKLSAIEALQRLPDPDAITLLRALALSRTEDRVAWEDEGGDWEDWLDVQIAAIRALGALGVTDAIEDMMAARDDEMGQSLDMPVFNALAGMGDIGVSWLVAVISTEGGQAGQRAAEVLADCAPEALLQYIDVLVESEDPRLRKLAIARIAPEDALLSVLALRDTDPSVRLAALSRAAPGQPDLALRALRDAEVCVQAEAVAHLPVPLPEDACDTIIDNLLAWVAQGPAALMRAAPARLALLAPERAAAPLLGLIGDTGQPLDARVAAAAALATIGPEVTTETLTALLANPAQQVRARLLALLAERAVDGDPEAQDALARAIEGTLLSEEEAVHEPAAEGQGRDPASPKDHGGPSRIRITREGEIEETGEAPPAGHPGSTLDAILADQTPAEPTPDAGPELAEDTPEESAPKRRRRRAVEGPNAIAEALMLEAVQTAGAVSFEGADAPLLAHACGGNEDLRRAAWQSIARRHPTAAPAGDVQEAARGALGDPDPVIRLAAFELTLRAEEAPALIHVAMRDEDALIRAMAVRALEPAEVLDHLGDPVLAVRRAALDRLSTAQTPDLATAAFDRLVDAERSDTLSELFSASAPATAEALSALTDASLPLRKALVILTALSQS